MRAFTHEAVLWLWSAIALTGCFAPHEAPGVAEEDVSEQEISSLRFYDCWTGQSLQSLKHLELGLGKTKLRTTDVSADAAAPVVGTLDAS